MSRRFLGCGFAVAVALSSTAMAQNPTTQPPPAQQPPPMARPAEPAKPAGATGTPVTIEGCVVSNHQHGGRNKFVDLTVVDLAASDVLVGDACHGRDLWGDQDARDAVTGQYR